MYLLPEYSCRNLTTMQAYLANVGQDEDWAEVEKKALYLGAEKMVIRDLQKEVCQSSHIFPYQTPRSWLPPDPPYWVDLRATSRSYFVSR